MSGEILYEEDARAIIRGVDNRNSSSSPSEPITKNESSTETPVRLPMQKIVSVPPLGC